MELCKRVMFIVFLFALAITLSRETRALGLYGEDLETGTMGFKNVAELLLQEMRGRSIQNKQQRQINLLMNLARELQRQVQDFTQKQPHSEGEENLKEPPIFHSSANKTNTVNTRNKRDIRNGPLPSGIASGATYTRWGRKTCPPGAELVYDGVIGGSLYTHNGGGSDLQCLPHNPQWGTYKDGFQSSAFMYGAELEIQANDPFSKVNTGRISSLQDETPVCAVCRSINRSSQVMIPARRECPESWTKEYNGYLMSAHHTHKKSQFVCIDGAPEVNEGGTGNQNGALLYVVEAKCGSLPCPSYVDGRELTCVVCSK